MKYEAFVKAIGLDIEEEIVIVVNGIELTGFISYCPYILEVGKTYQVSIDITILDDFKIRRIDEPVKVLQRIDQSFVYLIKGILKPGGVIESSIVIQDELFIDYAYLYNEFVETKADRIAISFW